MKKKNIITLLQVALTAGLLAFLFRNGALNRKMLAALSEANLWWIGAAFSSFLLVQISAITRWQILLRVQGIHIGWWRLAALFLIGIFFNPFIPGNTGGDVAKIYYLIKETPDKKPAAMLAVVMDRLMGLFGLIMVSAVIIALRYKWLTQTPVTAGLLYILLAIFGGALAFILFSFIVTGCGLVHKLPARMPLRDKLVEISVAYAQYGRAWKSSLVAFCLCIPVHLISFSLFYLVAKAFAESASRTTLWDFWGIMPIVNTITSIPVTTGGVGAREILMQPLLNGLCNVGTDTAYVVSFTAGYVVPLLWSIIGAVVYLFYRPTEHTPLAAMDQEVTQLEHTIAETEEAEKA